MTNTNQPLEIWKDIVGYEGYYQVSNLGNVKSLDRNIITSNNRKKFYKGKILKKIKLSTGYLGVNLVVGKKKDNNIQYIGF